MIKKQAGEIWKQLQFGGYKQLRKKYEKACGRLIDLFYHRSFTEAIVEEASKE